jgi:hypothetical protein
MKVIATKNLGMLLLGIWLIVVGLAPWLPLGILGNILAVAAGILILTGR